MFVMGDDKESQEDELLALDSIYDSGIFEKTVDSMTGLTGGQFEAHLDLPTSFQVKLKSGISEERTDTHPVTHLPPIILNFELPSDYPSSTAPSFTLSCKWLTVEQLSNLCRKLDDIWEESKGDVVLFMWTSFLKDDSIEFLKIESPLNLCKVVSNNKRNVARSNNANKEEGAMGGQSSTPSCHSSDSDNSDIDPRAIQDIASQELLLPLILEHNKQQEDDKFRTTLFTCQVCFMEKLGTLCTSFPTCHHVYCKECMKGYFEVQIQEGSVKALTCPDDKCESQAHPQQVKELVSSDLYVRYDRLLLQSSLDTMSDVIYCPRKGCECAVLVDHDHNLGNCPGCQYAFCIFCKLTFHGVSPCKVKSEEVMKLKEEWENANEEQKKFLEQRYGKKVIRQVVEESYSQAWIEEFSKKCPSCKTAIQKTDGCNKMTCIKCRLHFCWLCMTPISRSNPYSHFNQQDSPCFNRLFHGVIIDEFEDLDFEDRFDFFEQ